MSKSDSNGHHDEQEDRVDDGQIPVMLTDKAGHPFLTSVSTYAAAVLEESDATAEQIAAVIEKATGIRGACLP